MSLKVCKGKASFFLAKRKTALTPIPPRLAGARTDYARHNVGVDPERASP